MVTVSAVAACATSTPSKPGPEPVAIDSTPEPVAKQDHAEPPPAVVPEPSAPADASVDRAAPQPIRLIDYPKTLNPKDGADRTIKRAWQGDKCFVELPFPPLAPGQMRPPGSAPPSKEVPCPASMLTPAYEQCRGGVLRSKTDGSACLCFVMGNPPPPPRPTECP